MFDSQKNVTIFRFDPEDVVKYNFVFPDWWQQQHRGEEGGADHGHLDTDDRELVWVPRSRDPHAVHGDRHGDAAPGGGSGPHVAVVGPAAARQEAVAAGGSTAKPSRWAAGPTLAAPTSRPPARSGWVGGRDRGPVQGAALVSGWPPLLQPAAPLVPWAGPAIVPGG